VIPESKSYEAELT